MSLAVATAIILEGKGKHFDPEVIEAFVAVSDDLKKIADLWVDD
jgi:putative two-component system response regulator